VKFKIFGRPNAFSYNKKEIVNKDNKYYVGFWQNEKYFQEISDVIRKNFTLKKKTSIVFNNNLQKVNGSQNSISIHVRRTDILDPKNKYGGICDLEYYNKAIKYLVDKIDSNITLFIFSDDIEWCKENLKFPFPMTFVSSPEIPDYEELILMSKCKHNIIANSSFSWWGAWLNQNRDKIVVGPKKWVRMSEKNFKDIVPESWHRI
jgi:hypothetical protein